MLSIVRRELQVAARKRSLYWQRLIIGGTAALASVCFMLFTGTAPTQIGSVMFSLLAWGVFFVTLLDGIRCTGDSISWERREGTLGLLFLTDLRPYDIVLGKFTIAAIQTLTTLLVTFPMLALPLMIGGVTPEEWVRTIGALLVTALFSLSTALFFSSFSTNSLTAITASVVFLAACMIPFIALRILGHDEWTWLCGPLAMLHRSDNQWAINPAIYWNALIFSVSLSAVMLMATCRLIGRKGSFDAQSKGNTWWKRLLEPRPSLAQTFSEMGLADAPGLWLAKRTLPGARVLWILTITGAVICALVTAFGKGSVAVGILFGIQVTFCFLVKLWLGMVAPQSLHAARTTGALELLLCTPIRPDSLVRAQVEALRGYIFPPALTVCVGYPLAGILGALLAQRNFDQLDGLFVMIVGGLFWLVMFLLDFFAVAYTGLWFALTSPRIEQAVAKTIGFVLLAPWLLIIFPFFGWIAFLLWPVFWICWASFKVGRQFKDRAAEQFVRTL